MEIGRHVRKIKTFGYKVNQYLLSCAVIGGTTMVCTPLSDSQGYHIVSFILLFVVSFLSTFIGTGPILLASTLGALVWNYFFIPPHYTFHIDKTEDMLIFGLFFIIAIANGVLTTRVRRQEKLAREREKRTNALFQLTKELSKASGIDEVLEIAIEGIKNNFSVDPFFLLQDGNNLLHSSGRLRKGKTLSQNEYGAANWVFINSSVAGKFTDKFAHIENTIYPLIGTRINPGVIVVGLTDAFVGDKKVLWDTYLRQISNALEREFLDELARKARFLDESDKLYKTLFNSISHEFRIPVATILGAIDTLLALPHPGQIQSALFNEIFTASLRLNRLIENLLNMSRLESGRISARLDWYDINDLVNKLAEDLKEELKPYLFAVAVPEDMPLVKIDFGLMEQVLYNLLFNSCEYTPVASEICLDFSHKDDELTIKVMDKGPGFPEEALKNVFQKFFRVTGSKTGGLGLGLSIAKGFVEAHRGTIIVENRAGGGAMFTIKVPSMNPEMENLQLDKT